MSRGGSQVARSQVTATPALTSARRAWSVVGTEHPTARQHLTGIQHRRPVTQRCTQR